MKILDMEDAINLEASTTIEADTTPHWSSSTIYEIGEKVQYGTLIYKNAKNHNINNLPPDVQTAWTPITSINEKAIYDVYPDTISKNISSDITLTYNATNIDTIFVGNAKGGTVTVSVGSYSKSKNLIDSTVSPNQAWGLTDIAHGSGDLFFHLPTLVSDTLTIIITLHDNEASVGYIVFGKAIDMGLTLMNSEIKYNVVSGVKNKGTVLGAKRARKDSVTEITLPIFVKQGVNFSDILVKLAKYRGVPMLIIGDDTGAREEMTFWGIYSEIDASITQKNAYNLSLTSLDSSTFVPSTKVEDNEAITDTFAPADFVFYGFDSGSSDEVVFKVSSDIPYYYDGLALEVQLNNTLSSNSTLNMNGLGSVPVYVNGNLVTDGLLKKGETYLFYYRSERFNVSTSFSPKYGDNAKIDGSNLVYIDDNLNTISVPLSELINNGNGDASLLNNKITYTDDDDGVIVVSVEDLLNQVAYSETDKSSRRYIAGKPAPIPYASTSQNGVVQFATDSETDTGTSQTVAVTPHGLNTYYTNRIATDSETDTGTLTTKVVTPHSLNTYYTNRVATQSEVDARTNTTHYVTPKTLDESEATTSQKGLVELATCTEVNTGTDTTRAVTPSCLAGYLKQHSKVNAMSGVPTASDFSDNNDCVIFDCDTGDEYFLDSGTVTKKESSGQSSISGSGFVDLGGASSIPNSPVSTIALPNDISNWTHLLFLGMTEIQSGDGTTSKADGSLYVLISDLTSSYQNFRSLDVALQDSKTVLVRHTASGYIMSIAGILLINA